MLGTPIEGKHKGLGMTKEMVAFMLGRALSEIAVCHFLAPEKKDDLNRASSWANGSVELLDLNASLFRRPSPRTGDRIQDSALVLGYLLAPGHPGHDLGAELEKKHGKKISAYYELAIKPWVGWMMYLDGGPSQEARSAADSIEAAAKETTLPADVCEKVISALRTSNVSREEASRRIAVMHERIDTILKATLKK